MRGVVERYYKHRVADSLGHFHGLTQKIRLLPPSLKTPLSQIIEELKTHMTFEGTTSQIYNTIRRRDHCRDVSSLFAAISWPLVYTQRRRPPEKFYLAWSEPTLEAAELRCGGINDACESWASLQKDYRWFRETLEIARYHLLFGDELAIRMADRIWSRA